MYWVDCKVWPGQLDDCSSTELGCGALSAVVQQRIFTLLIAEHEPFFAVLELVQLHTAENGVTAGASGNAP